MEPEWSLYKKEAPEPKLNKFVSTILISNNPQLIQLFFIRYRYIGIRNTAVYTTPKHCWLSKIILLMALDVSKLMLPLYLLSYHKLTKT